MAALLVQYSDSEPSSEDDDDNAAAAAAAAAQSATAVAPASATLPAKHTLKRKASNGSSSSRPAPSALPALPASFLDLYATPVRTSAADDPALHGGRQRAHAHVPGNWPSHVYIEWRPDDGDADALAALVASLQARCPGFDIRSSLADEQLGTALPLHISLSRSLTLRAHQREGFSQALAEAVARADVGVFDVRLGAVRWVPNYEGNRWFLVARAERPEGDGLNLLLRACNRVAARLGQPMLYAAEDKDVEVGGPRGSGHGREEPKRRRRGRDGGKGEAVDEEGGEDGSGGGPPDDAMDRFHVSIAWTVRAPDDKLESATESVSQKMALRLGFQVDSIKAKIGNTIERISLSGGGNNQSTRLFG